MFANVHSVVAYLGETRCFIRMCVYYDLYTHKIRFLTCAEFPICPRGCAQGSELLLCSTTRLLRGENHFSPRGELTITILIAPEMLSSRISSASLALGASSDSEGSVGSPRVKLVGTCMNCSYTFRVGTTGCVDFCSKGEYAQVCCYSSPSNSLCF